MNFKRRIEWRKWLGVAGWVALGYFIGRPEQLSRMARNLENHLAGSRTQYLVPTTTGTAPRLVQIYQQPRQSFRSTFEPGQQGWNDFHDPNGHYSIMVPPHKVKQVTDTNSTMNSIRLGDELYIFGYMADERIQLISHDDKQALMRESLNKGWSSNGAAEQFSVVAQRHFGLNGNPGVEIHLQHRSKPIKMTFRQMIVGNRLYMTGVSSPSPQNEQTFLNSLRLH
ncbi:MAG: hypothetical protein JGK24_17075 [Microcoleus sp. PH2017_29_MFU_D_A]|uniref:hypothetical protein n=1 Tax=unclassified Microcoleus TaxID=2642155 RepID=UPI001E0D2809|nr:MULTISPECIES: hypothetical protein [unclassified Microcoleus]MCC3604882.1 hypothetical protein [Microcoleus sp. PH2017_29_MFU_D_A]MCC3635809.1 hypothetical protein [Microcoleus sp. PH2017_37_MFU_D_B]